MFNNHIAQQHARASVVRGLPHIVANGNGPYLAKPWSFENERTPRALCTVRPGDIGTQNRFARS
jgi:hypothetical protein